MDAHRDQRVFVRRIARLVQAAHHLRAHPVNTERHEFVASEIFSPSARKSLDKLLSRRGRCETRSICRYRAR